MGFSYEFIALLRQPLALSGVPSLADICEVAAGEKAKRENDSEIITYTPAGMGAVDVGVALDALNLARERDSATRYSWLKTYSAMGDALRQDRWPVSVADDGNRLRVREPRQATWMVRRTFPQATRSAVG